MSRVLILTALFLIHFSYAQKTINVTGSKITPQDAEAILNHHNKVRKDLGIAPLTWNPKLAAYAQAWADYLATSNNCDIKHRTECGENGLIYGENIYWGSSSAIYKPIDASITWYNEIKDYTYARLNENNMDGTGHYTQMIWKDTKEVGVGVAICPNGAIIVVANYYPAGNVIDQFPY